MLWNNGPGVVPGARLFVGPRGLKHQIIPMARTDDLEPCRHPALRETGRHGGGRVPREVKGIGKGHRIEDGDGAAVDLGRGRSLGGKGLRGHRRREEEIEAFKEVPENAVLLGPDPLRLDELLEREARAPLRDATRALLISLPYFSTFSFRAP